ncbi:hypothetical protein NDU88_008759 [Pleurodeles waltl]|uniref:Uncharacterized protein n=1 Tax=Pleurodeles waltl TaxID=8319 RepID=A0AAV7NYW1_PLEWA|nr:hypothetical protein NDU88_008759 [Pleurodeles waltl]
MEPRLVKWLLDVVKGNIEKAKKKYKDYHDERFGVNCAQLEVGEMVSKVREYESIFSVSFKVEKISYNSVKLIDGRIRHMNRMVKCKNATSEEEDKMSITKYACLDDVEGVGSGVHECNKSPKKDQNWMI